jgi:hypothetical protein
MNVHNFQNECATAVSASEMLSTPPFNRKTVTRLAEAVEKTLASAWAVHNHNPNNYTNETVLNVLVLGRIVKSLQIEDLRVKARRAVARGAVKPAVKAVRRYMYLPNSEERVGALMPLVKNASADIFWPIFVKVWPSCDRAWEWNEQIVRVLRRIGPCPADLRSPFFNDLPETVAVYRGASRLRIEGAISWTTDPEVARLFARGHRGIPVPDPVIAIGTIAKVDVFFATDDRNEREVICLPEIDRIIAVTT